MKALETIAKVLKNLWKFLQVVILICLVSAVAVFILTIFMPDNVRQAIEIVRGIIP